MRKASLGITAALAAASLVVLAGPAQAATVVIDVPYDFDAAYSGTRSAGHYAVQGSSLHVFTDDSSSQAKVAEYVDVSAPLSGVGEPALNYTTNSGTIPPGFQLVVDFDNDGTPDGILVGEPTYYGNDWWANTGSAQFVKDGAPVNGGGSGSPWHGTLDQWRASFPNAQVKLIGFSLGSGVHGDYLLNSMTFNGDTYVFAPPTKKTCKDAVSRAHKAFEDKQKADKKAFDDQQKADKAAFEATNPTKDQKKAFEDQQKADKMAFDNQQKAAKQSEDAQHKADDKACDSLPDH